MSSVIPAWASRTANRVGGAAERSSSERSAGGDAGDLHHERAARHRQGARRAALHSKTSSQEYGGRIGRHEGAGGSRPFRQFAVNERLRGRSPGGPRVLGGPIASARFEKRGPEFRRRRQASETWGRASSGGIGRGPTTSSTRITGRPHVLEFGELGEVAGGDRRRGPSRKGGIGGDALGAVVGQLDRSESNVGPLGKVLHGRDAGMRIGGPSAELLDNPAQPFRRQARVAQLFRGPLEGKFLLRGVRIALTSEQRGAERRGEGAVNRDSGWNREDRPRPASRSSARSRRAVGRWRRGPKARVPARGRRMSASRRLDPHPTRPGRPPRFRRPGLRSTQGQGRSGGRNRRSGGLVEGRRQAASSSHGHLVHGIAGCKHGCR